MEWNNVFYVLVANELMDAGDNRFDELLAQIEGLPDRSFGDVSEIVLHAADVCYFNDISRSPERAVELRRRLVARASTLRYWNHRSAARRVGNEWVSTFRSRWLPYN